MTTKFIDIKRIAPSGDTSTASLGISDRSLNVLQVIGGLPHGYDIAPNTDRDAASLRAWLDVHYPNETTETAGDIADSLATLSEQLSENVLDTMDSQRIEEIAKQLAIIALRLRAL